MLLTLQGFWTVALYFGLLGVIWLPRYYVIPAPVRLWPTYWFYNTIANNFALPPFSVPGSIEDKKVYQARNFTFNVDYKEECFSCKLRIQPKHCNTLIYSDIIFDSIHTSDSYDVYTYENYPCYQTLSKTGQCVIDDTTNIVFSGTGCTLCSLCHKNTMFNTSARNQYRKYSYTPRFSLSLGAPRPPGVNTILHCLNKLVLIRFYDKAQFCTDLERHLSVYKQDKTTVVTGCSSFCTDSSNIVYRELYNTELGVYLILLAGVVLCIVGIVSAIGYVVSLYYELGILNVAWNSSRTCPICMDKLYRLTRISTLHCGHMFCRACLHRWLYVFCHVTCPLCRTPVDPSAPVVLATTDTTTPPVLMLSDTAHSEGEEDDRVSTTSDTSLSNSFIQSIYNIGRNVVAGWSSGNVTSRPYTEEGGDQALLGDIDPGTNDSEDVSHVTSQPIPMPYYPLYSVDSTPSFNSIIVPYRRLPVLGNTPLYNSYNYFCSSSTNLASFPSNFPNLHSNQGLHPPQFQDVSLSDSELPSSSSRLQNRIARKLNRQRRMRGRRSHSTSDITTSNVTSESEVDVF